ncbi:MAG TPA: DUF72 domain-containing protein, partial [Flavobacteriales bacterium]|nr:DUF72 domain-containing protein [Flavobacteriales bacterium]
MRPHVRIGVAGWALGKAVKGLFPEEGTHLARYAQVFNAVEINSTFYRMPRAGTLERWAASTPPDFRFAVKMPKAITHERRLAGAGRELMHFLEALEALGERCGPVLVQLPPSL